MERLSGRDRVAEVDPSAVMVCHVCVLSRLARQHGNGKGSIAAVDPQHDFVARVVVGICRERQRWRRILRDHGAVGVAGNDCICFQEWDRSEAETPPDALHL